MKTRAFSNLKPRKLLALLCGAILPALLASSATAQISITAPALPVTENFDSMGTNSTAALPAGWKMSAAGAGTAAGYATAANTNAVSQQASSGTPTSGGRYNWGSSATDRAAGFMTSGGYASANALMAAYVNNTGSTITSIAITFTYERYRVNSAAASVAFFTSTDGSTWVAETSGDSGAFATGTSTYTFSNGTTVTKTVNLTGLNIANGSQFYVKWNFNTTGSNSQGLGLDGVSLTADTSVTGAPVITSSSTASAVAYATTANIYQITASNSPTSYGASGLPTGLSIDTATGVISGTATTPGVYTVGITATNSQGTGAATLTLTVTKNPGAPTITSALTAIGVVGTSFSYSITAGNTPTSYSSGTLPSGLSLDTSTGVISGTPTAGGTFNVSITAANALGSDTQTLVLSIGAPPVITSPTSGSLYDTDNFGYTITATFMTNTNSSSYGATGLPEGWGLIAGTNGITNIITNGLTALTNGTTTFAITASNDIGLSSTNYTLQVYDQAAQDAVPLNVVVNKYLNGTPDKVQLLVVGDGTPGSTADMRGMIIKDFSGNMANDSGGKFIFATNALWSAVPAGTLITLSSGTTQTEVTTSTNFYLAVNLGNTNYFTSGGGTFDISTTEMVLLKAAGSGVTGVAGGIHAMAGGTAGAQFIAYTGAKLRAAGTSGTSIGVIALNSTSQLSDFGTSGQGESTDAQGNIASASLDFTTWNNVSNGNFIKALRGTIDGTGSAVISNGTTNSPFVGQNLFGRSLSGQTVQVVYTPSSASTPITGISIEVPSAFGVPLAGNVSVTGTGSESATIGVAGQVITISGLSAINPDPITVAISGLSTPDTATPVTNTGAYAFNMQSQGGVGGSLSPLAGSPSARVLIPIANVRNADPTTFVPVLLNQTVAVEGVCSVGRLSTGTTSSALQDSTHGVYIYSLSTVPGPQTRGNRYAVVGAVAQFNGLVQLNLSDPALVFDLGADVDPAPVTVTVPQFNASTGATNGITLQSRVVRIQNLTYVSGTWATGQTVVLQDASTNQLSVRIQSASTAKQPTYPVTITGIAGQYDTASPYDLGFQLQPRDQADAPALAPTITSSLTASANLNEVFSYQITATDNPPATSYDATPLPTGLSIDTATGVISGTPTAGGTFNITISATNGGGTGSATLVLTVGQAGSTFTAWAGGAPLNSTNLLKYAIGGATNASATNGVVPVSGLTSNALTITAIVRTNDPSLSVFGQSITNLMVGLWSTNDVSVSAAGSQVGVPEGCQMQIFSTPRTTNDARKFLQLRSTLIAP